MLTLASLAIFMGRAGGSWIVGWVVPELQAKGSPARVRAASAKRAVNGNGEWRIQNSEWKQDTKARGREGKSQYSPVGRAKILFARYSLCSNRVGGDSHVLPRRTQPCKGIDRSGDTHHATVLCRWAMPTLPVCGTHPIRFRTATHIPGAIRKPVPTPSPGIEFGFDSALLASAHTHEGLIRVDRCVKEHFFGTLAAVSGIQRQLRMSPRGENVDEQLTTTDV